jgi:DNA topoisomerase-1
MDLEGRVVKCAEYKLQNNEIERTEKEKTFGNEKNKLVIQPVGILTIEFLIAHFDELFSYEYTNQMEMKLDIISKPHIPGALQSQWFDICNECYNEIKKQSREIKIEKQQYKIDEEYELVFQQFGPVLRKRLEDGTFEYKSIKKDITLDLEKAKRGEYTMEDLMEQSQISLGNYKDLPVILKNGRYGPYIEWSDKKESVKQIEKGFSQITLEDVLSILDPENNPNKDITYSNEVRSISTNKNILRIINTETMSSAKFYNLNHFNKPYLTCDLQVLKDWIKEKHGIS